MAITQTITLNDNALAAANLLGKWLAQNDSPRDADEGEADLIVLAGNAVIPTIDAAMSLASRRGLPLLISGGIGHSTEWLYRAVAADHRYRGIAYVGRCEADILADVARRYYRLTNIVVENQSTNCGENARFTRQLLDERHLSPQRVLVAQDPTMQRRTMATFARVWRNHDNAPHWLSYPGVTPRLERSGKGLQFAGLAYGMWPVERYLALICGELPRLRDNPQGYGPRGRDFIAYVEIPEEIEAAWQRLTREPGLKDVVGGRQWVK